VNTLENWTTWKREITRKLVPENEPAIEIYVQSIWTRKYDEKRVHDETRVRFIRVREESVVKSRLL